MHKIASFSAAMLSVGAFTSAVAQTQHTPIFTVDSENPTQVDLDSMAAPALENNTGTAGIVVLLCWSGVSSTAETLDFQNGNVTPVATNEILSSLKRALIPQGVQNPPGQVPSNSQRALVIGIKAGGCSPSWLTTGITPSVPMPNFYARPWQDAIEGQTLSCHQYQIVPSWDPKFGAEYVTAVTSLIGTLQSIVLGDGHTMLDHVVAIADGAMIQTGSDEMGVFANGCTINGTVTMMTDYQAAQTWASLPPPDNYTPAKAQAAYRTIYDGMLNAIAGKTNLWGNQIEITQTMDGSDGHNWPRLDANGIPLPPQQSSIPAVAMYAPILQQATNDTRDCYSNNGVMTSGPPVQQIWNCTHATQVLPEQAADRVVFGWPGLFNDSDTNQGYPVQSGQHYPGNPVNGVQLVVNNGVLYGGGVKWQFNNDNGGSTGDAYIDGTYFNNNPPDTGHVNATSCVGREGTVGNNVVAPLADQTCFTSMLALANRSSVGTITASTVLDPNGPGINPPSYYGSHHLLLQWIEAKAIDGLPTLFDDDPHQPRGPFYGCYYTKADDTGNSVGPNCP